jgi:hypothetical protein
MPVNNTASYDYWYEISSDGIVLSNGSSGRVTTTVADGEDPSGDDGIGDLGEPVVWSQIGSVTVVGVTADGDPILMSGSKYFVLTNQPLDTGESLTVLYTGFVFCFMAGTLIGTPSGQRPVEALQIGDFVSTADGATTRVKFIGRQSVSARFAGRNLPVEIGQGGIAPDLPQRALRLSPDHAVQVGWVLAQAKALVNGTTIRQLGWRDCPETFVYFHIETDDHALILAEGLAAETFLDNVSRRGFDNWAEYVALFGDYERPIAEMPMPRAHSQRQLPIAVKQALFGPHGLRRAG